MRACAQGFSLIHMIIDMHTHAGWGRLSGPVDRANLETMKPGGVTAAVVAAVADAGMIRVNAAGTAIEQHRTAEPGEGWRDTIVQLDAYQASGFRIAREPDEIRAGDPAIVLAVEGCDFLDGDLDRFDAMAERGVRSIQLAHYVVNETADIQTAPAVHHGLTPFGAEAVRRMQERGIMVDVTHCTEATVRGVAKVTRRPFLCTHSNLIDPNVPNGNHPRFISRTYAEMVVDSGGVIGAWIAVLFEEGFAGLVRHLFRLIDAVGVEHVGIGTDMPLGVASDEMPDFRRHQELAQAMRDRGMTAAEVEKVCAGNWLRVFRAAREGIAG
ncbi:MAG TPA: membrane dipeptidase [Acetobacteraceae bacterium]|nr:membrane dipeptidase [Acetobacteraceae bacterium]